MKVIFLCGGSGKRMFPITTDKFMLKFLGKTLLEHQVEIAQEAGLTNFIFVGNPQNTTAIQGVIESIPGIRAEIVTQDKPLGIANALQSAGKILEDEIMVVNPNDIFEGEVYKRLFEASREKPVIAYLTGYEVSSYFPGGYLVIGKDGYLRNIVEKPEKGKEPSNLVNILVHHHTDPEILLKYIAEISTDRDDVYERALDALAKEKQGIRVVPYAGVWCAIKYPWHILDAVRCFLDRAPEQISPSAIISERAVVAGKVIIGDNVRVLENAVVRGPVYIGANSVIGNNSLVREYSHIGSDCVVGYSTEIKGSYVEDGCFFHMNYIGDSVLGERCSFGAGTVTANWRFDEGNINVNTVDGLIDSGRDKLGIIAGKNCKIGVNVNIMPGVTIGVNSIVGPGVYLADNLTANKVIFNKPAGNNIKDRTQSFHDNEIDTGKG